MSGLVWGLPVVGELVRSHLPIDSRWTTLEGMLSVGPDSDLIESLG